MHKIKDIKRIDREEWAEIRGFVLPNEADRHNRVLEIVIETEDFQQYIVFNDPKGMGLFDHMFREVTVRGGIVGENIYGKPIIKVADFRLVDDKELNRIE